MADEATISSNKRAAYDPSKIEQKWYDYWEKGGFFEAVAASEAPPHTIMMPPPNVTGRLHMGHALQDTIQDAITRLRRMQGYESLWMPGMDHAGIATQNVVEKELIVEEGKDRHALGRDAFLQRIWKWTDEYGGLILQQKRRLGDSCDWQRSRFTMDEGFSRAVQEVFVRLYNEGLIYRGDYLVNWCPKDQTALSDEEVDNVERDGHLWHIRYMLSDGSGSITIATTRPETLLGDTAVAVHPDDDRYSHLIGKTVRVPLIGRDIPIIADEYVQADFGAGALKVTPAHDKNDFDIGRRHDLESVTVINPDATLNDNAGPYEGLDRFVAREKIVQDLEAQGLLERVEFYRSTVPVSSRSKDIIEPLISRQWFVRMKPLAEPAIEAVRSGKVKFYRDRWSREYFRWMENIRDWTISRQLWWGHRIPVWYHLDENGEIDEGRDFIVSVDQPEEGMVQDEDVLDTWFSSWLWPFATLGWPEENADLKKFYPTDVLVSGYDILFFWIARMVMAGIHFTGEVPFRDIFITGMIKDKHGRWMSKSLGNGIDPIDMIDQYGADAVRFSLTILCAQGQDIKLDPSKFEMGRNFANKIWNAFNVFGQFMRVDDASVPVPYERKRSLEELDLAEKWILHRLNTTIAKVDEALDRYRMNEALSHVYDLFWKDYCDWYLELLKPADGAIDEDRLALAIEVYEKLLLLLHPFMPFITEELWWRLRPRAKGASIMVEKWPQRNAREEDPEAGRLFEAIQAIVSGIRNVRSEYNVPPGRKVAATLSVPRDSAALAAELEGHKDYVMRLARLSELTIGQDLERPPASAVVVAGKFEVHIPLAGLIDLEVERQRLQKEIDQKVTFLVGVQKKLQNPQFVSRAPKEVVARERAKEKDAAAEISKLRSNLEDLSM